MKKNNNQRVPFLVCHNSIKLFNFLQIDKLCQGKFLGIPAIKISFLFGIIYTTMSSKDTVGLSSRKIFVSLTQKIY
jgi:hypothetical protein